MSVLKKTGKNETILAKCDCSVFVIVGDQNNDYDSFSIK